MQENYKIMFLQDLIKLLQEKPLEKSFIFNARFMQDLMQNFANLARKILARLEYFLQDDFTGYALLAPYIT